MSDEKTFPKNEYIFEYVAHEEWSHKEHRKSLARSEKRTLETLFRLRSDIRLVAWSLVPSTIFIAFFVFIVAPYNRLQITIQGQSQKSIRGNQKHPHRYKLPPKARSVFELKGKWKIQVTGPADIAFSKPSRTQKVVLRRGQIDVSVKPKSMKSFQIHVGSVFISVIGTQFTVNHQHKWVRVDVQRGNVSFKSPKAILSLKAKQGVRYTFAQKKMTQHRCSSKVPLVTLKCLAHVNMKQAVQYELDLSQLPGTPREGTYPLLSFLADFAKRNADWSNYISLSKRLFKLASSKQREEIKQSLFEAAKACKRRSKRECIPLYRQYLQLATQQDGSTADIAMYHLSGLLLLVKPFPKRELQQLIQRYKKNYPDGVFAQEMRLRHARILRMSGASCKHARRALIAGDVENAWLRKHCPKRENR
tara:strand:- start:5709 stop:6965 length:1257 start_codon:yes stop_codon:yes gene_type:complete